MADATADDLDLDGETEGEDGGPEKKKFSGKKLVLFVVLPVVLVLGAVVAVFLSGALDSLLGSSEGKPGEVKAEPKAVTFLDLPELVVNLNSSGKQASYLKISVSLELPSEEVKLRVEELMPRIIDQFQVYLRETRREDLNGSAGLYRLKEELLLRVNTALYPDKINSVLFKDFIVQ